MDPRKRQILKAIIEDYISNAEPVGSKTLAERHNINFSTATLRHDMAILEEQGYIEQPHTSAGRIPTAQGYRIYVDDLMQRHHITLDEIEAINSAMRLRMQECDRILEEAGKLVARLTRYAAITAQPQENSVTFHKFELFLAEQCALVIVAVLDGERIRNRLLRLQRPADVQAVSRLTDALNTCFTGQSTLTDAAAERCALMAGPGAEYLPPIMEFLREIIRSPFPRESYLSGEAQLLDHPEFRDVLKARQTLEYLAERRQNLMDARLPADEVRITIGPENLAEELQNTSVIMASFRLGEGRQGLIGLVGPTRMDYSKLASHLSYMAARLSALLMEEDIN